MCIEKVLRSIAGYARMNVAALRIESGVWDTKTRAQMLLMRLHAKICSSDQHSLISRVVRMSMKALAVKEMLRQRQGGHSRTAYINSLGRNRFWLLQMVLICRWNM